MIPSIIEDSLRSYYLDQGFADFYIKNNSSVSGGCIHQAKRLETNVGDLFIKYNEVDSRTNFEAEIKGLKLLLDQDLIGVPQPITCSDAGRYSFLLMNFIPTGERKPDFWIDFGHNLAALHKCTQGAFGLDHENFIGALPQINQPKVDWIDFFISQRIQPMLEMADLKGLASPELRKKFEELYPKLPSLMPKVKPSLLHGDLWSGNFLTGPKGDAVILDPAVYYGHREAEIAFTQLFGGFAPQFYHAYNQAWPLTKGWENRVDLFNLYPLLVHLNLFGTSYLGQIERILKRFA